MKGFIELVDQHGTDTLLNVAHIKTIWRQSLGRASIHMQGDPTSEFITTHTSYEDVQALITKSFD